MVIEFSEYGLQIFDKKSMGSGFKKLKNTTKLSSLEGSSSILACY